MDMRFSWIANPFLLVSPKAKQSSSVPEKAAPSSPEEEHDSTLVSVHSEAENNFVKQICRLKRNNNRLWMEPMERL